MPRRDTRIFRLLLGRHFVAPILVALGGAAVCLIAVLGFVATVATNNLPWHPDWTVQEHYLEIGRFYSQGFLAGFFFCFFLVFGAVSLSAWVRRRRELRGREEPDARVA